MNYVDKTLTCADCGATFLFSAGEQEFFATKGFRNEPKRCPDCRRIRRSRMNALSSGPRQMYPVICAQCGVETEVPFQPTGVRPVYCRACFDKLRESGLESQPTAAPTALETVLAPSSASSLVEPTPSESAPEVSSSASSPVEATPSESAPEVSSSASSPVEATPSESAPEASSSASSLVEPTPADSASVAPTDDLA